MATSATTASGTAAADPLAQAIVLSGLDGSSSTTTSSASAAAGSSEGESRSIDGSRPLKETSKPIRHSIGLGGTEQNQDQERAAGSEGGLPGSGAGVGEYGSREQSGSRLGREGEIDRLAGAARTGAASASASASQSSKIAGPSKSSSSSSSETSTSASPNSKSRISTSHSRKASFVGALRNSMDDSVSFGFKDNLLPLTLSGNEYDDDEGSENGGYEFDYDQEGRNGAGVDPSGMHDHSSGQRGYGDVEGATVSQGRRRNRGRRKRYRDTERRMGLVDGIALTVGLQIGSGIFSSPGVVTLNTGSIGASILVWLFSGILAWTGASSLAELGSAIPQNGGAQAYLNYAFGPLPSYLFSWTAIVALKPGSGAIIAIIFGEYLARVLFHASSGSSTEDPHEQGLEGIPQWSVKLSACVIVVLISAMNAFSARLGTRTQVATTVVKLIALVAVPVLAIIFAVRGKIPAPSKQAFSSFGSLFAGSATSPSAYALALYSGLWAYDGWDQTSYVAGEMSNVTRDLPRVIHVSMTLVIFFFVLTVTSYFLVLPPSLVRGTNTVALDFGSAIFGTTGGVIFSCLVVFSCFGALNSQIYTSSRLVFAAGKEGYLPALFGKVNSRTATPVAATIFQAALVLLFILFGSGFASLVSFYGVCSYTWYFLTVASLLVLRIKEPNLERPYKVWLVTPVLFATTALFLLVMPIASAPIEALAAVAFMATGLPAYYIGVRRAREAVLEKLSNLCGGITACAPTRTTSSKTLRGRPTRRDGSRKGGSGSGSGSGTVGDDDEEGDYGGEEAVEMLDRRSDDHVGGTGKRVDDKEGGVFVVDDDEEGGTDEAHR